MPATPADDHTQELEQLAGLAALDLLEGDDLDRFEQHAAQCERCRVLVRLDREALARAAPAMDPSPGFKARLMQRAALEIPDAQSGAAEESVEALPPNVIPLWRRAPRWASALAALFVVGLIGLGGYAFQNQVVASYPLTGSLTGSAAVNMRRSGATELELRGLESPPPGFMYEAWVIPPGGKPVAAGVLSSGNATLPLAGVGDGSTVAITRERQQVDAPTETPPLSVVVRS
jgi:anti-sigma-K factor RskA